MEEEITIVENVPFVDWPLQDQLLMVGGISLAIIFYAAMFYLMWRWIRATIQLPKEVSRTANALERIATQLEKRN